MMWKVETAKYPLVNVGELTTVFNWYIIYHYTKLMSSTRLWLIVFYSTYMVWLLKKYNKKNTAPNNWYAQNLQKQATIEI